MCLWRVCTSTHSLDFLWLLRFFFPTADTTIFCPPRKLSTMVEHNLIFLSSTIHPTNIPYHLFWHPNIAYKHLFFTSSHQEQIVKKEFLRNLQCKKSGFIKAQVQDRCRKDALGLWGVSNYIFSSQEEVRDSVSL